MTVLKTYTAGGRWRLVQATPTDTAVLEDGDFAWERDGWLIEWSISRNRRDSSQLSFSENEHTLLKSTMHDFNGDGTDDPATWRVVYRRR